MPLPRALTGIQPSGTPHLGNYKGMIEPALALQNDYDAYYFIASYHALTTLKDPEQVRANQRVAAAVWLAFGLDPSRTALFLQQDVPEVCELAWILGCHVGMGYLERAHAYKSAVESGKPINLGTVSYPVLMAADILIYDSQVVPVGRDQKQHVELARDWAQSFNQRYGEVFVLPTPMIREEVAVVPGIDGRKMSKSYGNDIAAMASGKKLRKRMMKIVTDSATMADAKDPDTCTVFALYKLFASPEEQADLAARYRAGGMGYGHAKQTLYEKVESSLAEPRERYAELMADPGQIDRVLVDGAERARVLARATVDRVRNAVGL